MSPFAQARLDEALCALTATLILDEDGVYDPACFNDRLLLGLKGTMSEAELHILRARMRGGQLNKARRGELEIGPPVGLVYRPDGSLDLDPDVEVQGALRLVFDTFERTGSAIRTVRFFLEQGILFPRLLRKEPNKGELLWAPPRHARILQVLHNPRYAGAFVYGRTRTRHRPDGRVSQIKVPIADWQFVMPDQHRGYIDWERFKANQVPLADNAPAFGIERRSGPVREGPALLQGRVLCGLCGGANGRPLQPRTWSDRPSLSLPGDRGPPRRKDLPVGSRQGGRSSGRRAFGRVDDAHDLGGQPRGPARTRGARRRDRCSAPPAYPADALRGRTRAAALHEGRPR